MAYKQGSYEVVQIWKEATRGTTPGVPVGHLMPLYDRGFDLFEETPQDVSELDGTPSPGQPGRGVIKAEGPLTVPCDEVAIGLWLNLILPTYSHAGVGDPYSHTWKLGTSEPNPFGVELGNTAASKYDVIPGCAVRGLSFVAEKTPAKLTFTVDLVGCIGGPPALKAAASLDLAPVTYVTGRYNLFPTVVKVATVATTFIQRMTLNIRREVTAEHILDGLRYAKACSFGGVLIDGEITALWDDADTIREYAMGAAGAAGAEKNLEFLFTSLTASHDLTITVPESTVFIPNAPGLGGRGLRKITLGFKGYKQDSADAPLMAVLRNATPDYEAIWT